MPGLYKNSVSNLLNDDIQKIIGFLSSGIKNQELLKQQRISWFNQISYLKDTLSKLPSDWTVILEYAIPRRAKRIDVVLLAQDLIFVIEFKDKETKYTSDAINQVEDYSLDLRDFHKQSLDKTIIPIVWASDAKLKNNAYSDDESLVKGTLFANNDNLHSVVIEAFNHFHEYTATNINPEAWDNSEYQLTPTIIEAAQYLFSNHTVADISRSHSGIENLTATTNAVLFAIEKAKQNQEKIICFITGVPGAGKTLAGLNIVHSMGEDSAKGVFLSGNGPLVKVLTEALARNNAKQKNVSLGSSRREVPFIQNVHQFLDFYHDNDQSPTERIILFDEAQRAWSAEHSKRKFNRDYSEAEMLFNIMNRIDGWGVIVALIGSGQEINTGEAGLSEWGKTISLKHPNWKVYISPELKEGKVSMANYKLFEGDAPDHIDIIECPELHLKVSIRSYKAEKLSDWVVALLENKKEEARYILEKHLAAYPIYITRNLDIARAFLRSKNRGFRKIGLVASSGARRLRPLGLDVTIELDVVNWFLNHPSDVRSSSFLELPATEFAVQGLELDWVGLCWGDDFRKIEDGWSFHSFKGTKWQIERQEQKKQFIKNKYRVLLTRGREGLVIFISEGSSTDSTRPKENYDSTYLYLKEIGIKELK